MRQNLVDFFPTYLTEISSREVLAGTPQKTNIKSQEKKNEITEQMKSKMKLGFKPNPNLPCDYRRFVKHKCPHNSS